MQWRVLGGVFGWLLVALPIRGQVILDPGFESVPVPAGDYRRPTGGPWNFDNDAAVVRPFAPSHSFGVFETWSATFSPYEGEQYVSTYAGSDDVFQTVFFPEAGVYRLSVFAASPEGLMTPSNQELVDGEFGFTWNNFLFGDRMDVPAGSDWTEYSIVLPVDAPGSMEVGVRNTKTARYFVNYDAFSVTLIPEPGGWALMGVGLAVGFGTIRRRRGRGCVRCD